MHKQNKKIKPMKGTNTQYKMVIKQRIYTLNRVATKELEDKAAYRGLRSV